MQKTAHNPLKNFVRHAFVALGAVGYLGTAFLLLYQYLGVLFDWPGVFLRVVRDAAGDWWLDMDWGSPALWGSVAVLLACAATYGLIRRNDDGEYRESVITSQPGF